VSGLRGERITRRSPQPASLTPHVRAGSLVGREAAREALYAQRVPQRASGWCGCAGVVREGARLVELQNRTLAPPRLHRGRRQQRLSQPGAHMLSDFAADGITKIKVKV